MADQTITITLSESAMRRLQRAAELTERSIDEVLSNTIDAALPPLPSLPSEIADEVAAMYLLSDAALWAAAQPSLAPPEQRQLQQLNQAAGEGSLTEAEAIEQIALINAYHRSVLSRAQALAVLALRGHPIQQICPSLCSVGVGANGDVSAHDVEDWLEANWLRSIDS